MKIAIYVQDMRASGVVRAMLGIARALAEGGDDVTIVAGHASGLFGADDAAPAAFAAARNAPLGPLPRLGIVPPLRRTLRALRPDVILSGGNFGHFSVWAATRGLRLPIVYCFSNPMERAHQPWRNRWRRVWSGVLIRGAARAILVGGGLAESAVFRPHAARGRAVTIRNGVDLARARLPAGPAPAAMAGPDPVILSIGRLQPQKNLEGLIDAVAVAAATRPLRLVILGAGATAYGEALMARAVSRGIGDRVLLAGVTDDVFAWLRAARVFALASKWEGSSIALLEAMAAGTPVVASPAAGDAAEVLDHGRYGLLADGENPAAFAAALLAQIDDPVRSGDRAHAFDAVTMVRAYREVLRGACRASARDARRTE